MSLKINDDNYQNYKKVFEILCRHLYKEFQEILPAGSDPVTLLTTMESKNKSIAKKGLKAGLLDIISEIKFHSQKTISEVNADLEKNGLPNVNKLTGIIRDSVKKVLKTKKIKNIDQYYIIKELLDDTVSDITEEERKNLSNYMADFEMKATIE